MDGVIFEIYSAYPILEWKFIQIKAVTYAGCNPQLPSLIYEGSGIALLNWGSCLTLPIYIEI